MTKKDLIASIATENTNVTKKDITTIVDSVFTGIAKVVTSGEEVSIPNFGIFKASLQKGKSGKVPGTDKTYTTQDKMVPKFKASKPFKLSVAAGK